LLTIFNNDPSLTIVNNNPSLTIINDDPSLTIVNNDPSLTIPHICQTSCKTTFNKVACNFFPKTTALMKFVVLLMMVNDNPSLMIVYIIVNKFFLQKRSFFQKDCALWFGIDSFVCLCPVDIEAYEIMPIGLALIVLCAYVLSTLKPLRSCPLVWHWQFVCLCPVDIEAYAIVSIGLPLIVCVLMFSWHLSLWDHAHWFGIDSFCAYVQLTLKPMRSCPLVCHLQFVCSCPVDIEAYEIVPICLALLVLCAYVQLTLKPMRSKPFV